MIPSMVIKRCLLFPVSHSVSTFLNVGVSVLVIENLPFHVSKSSSLKRLPTNSYSLPTVSSEKNIFGDSDSGDSIFITPSNLSFYLLTIREILHRLVKVLCLVEFYLEEIHLLFLNQRADMFHLCIF